MASRTLHKIPSRLPVLLRNYSKKKEESTSFWDYFKSYKKKTQKPPVESCRKRQAQRRRDPDLSRFGGQPYRTCGSAYVIQKDLIPVREVPQSDEDVILRKIEADMTNKDDVCDPMPPFQSVEQRLLDLNERRLHPFYKRYMTMPKRHRPSAPGDQAQVQNVYHCKTGPIQPGEIPDNFKFNRELLDKKNIFADFKQVELPKQLVVRMLEMDKNRKPSLEKKNKESQ
ncbi:uncharacterized protein BDFB_012199 [Asbolus verrucosus]|uniref:Uncharacterized protein n=1 Tax=Asbolus verrucosus TaxID=1661398 RepID=A0A482VPV7_ASBVE|nr:uncharacterized protein BDFB_012199 [Asbolus verrucosus]